ncbi:MAG: hypothetical protein QNJ68_07525 [Microcoleaceae cyanobacterium MO_207.B10]|nr:hypothetical protein [Microcoleaceae cyanobacterium MO_207.B10]
MIVSSISVVVGEKLRKKDFSCYHHNSTGCVSGEYGEEINARTLSPKELIFSGSDVLQLFFLGELLNMIL